MAPPAVASTTEVKHTVGEGSAHGGGHGHRGHGHDEEGKAGDPAKPVVIVTPGPTGSHKLDGKGLRVTIVASRWHEKVIHSLVEACSEELLDKGVTEKDLECVEVAGAFELPFAAAQVIKCSGAQRPDAVICIGCFVKDATMTCQMMGPAVATGIMKLNVDTDIPVICGLLCCESETQAHACATEQTSRGGGGGTKCNHGVSWAQSALEMARLKRCLAAKRAEQCSCVCHCATEDCLCACHCSECPCGVCTCKENECGCARCTSCHGGKSNKGEASTACESCGAPAAKCPCTSCKCVACTTRHAGEPSKLEAACQTCGSAAGECPCVSCKCPACTTRHAGKAGKAGTLTGCQTCGASAGKCPCTDCKCPTCCSKAQTT